MTSMSVIKKAVLGAALGVSALVAAPALAQHDLTAPAVAGSHQAQPGGAQKVAPKKKAAPKKVVARKSAKKSVSKPASKPTKVAKRTRKAVPDKHQGSPTHRTHTATPKVSTKHQVPHRG
ncbi:hypothetical protein SAMN05216359_10629 [Roseateles sp. YR242]|uniref:hypothetical protein n=1 Tax=Roseateles sp. YR242 TaxID=1855305 RepID=UPI0008B2F6CD|nr:hypothetical protein [Roseateles sp. YR242]SEL17417.1 hypothetical protein SAMN05216359_10629 [Roseateles sp. YR242]